MTNMRRCHAVGSVAATVVMTLGGWGCVTAPRVLMRADRYRIDVRLDPHTHRLSGRTTIDLVRQGDQGRDASGPVAVEFLLHPELRVRNVRASGATIRSPLTTRISPLSDAPAPEHGREGDDFAPRRHVVFLQNAVDAMTLFIDYDGRLYQDVAAGEAEGAIHNLKMRAHIAEEGVYLAGGYWYPQPVTDPDHPSLSDFTLIAHTDESLSLVASGRRDPASAGQPDYYVWHSPYPLEGMALVGGVHEIHRAEHNGVAIAVHLKPDQAKYADGLIDAVSGYLDRYEPLIGPYPAGELKVVDNFFSSGFAFPTFTLLSSAVINMGERSQTTHGYIDHEVLHSWWGNGVHVDPRDGNWCEALASYGANYYGFVLDGNEHEARRKRRNYAHFLSRLKVDRDKPLGTYGRPDGCGRGIAYNKGAAVFHMLARRLGQDNFWGAMRQLTDQYVGRYASWSDIQHVCEQQVGTDLSTFFEQWVRRGGAPQLAIDRATYDSAQQELTLTLSQGDPAFTLDVPIRVTGSDGEANITVAMREAVQDVTVPFAHRPQSVELDPEYHIFRKIPLGEILPTTASTRFGEAFTVVVGSGEVADRYKRLRSIFESGFEESQRLRRKAGKVDGEALAERCVLVLGAAARDPYVGAFLSAIEFPVNWVDAGFEFDGVEYIDPGDAVLCTVRHPGVPGGGVTVVYANSADAIPMPFAIPMYEHSVVVFQNGRAVVRSDLEFRAIVAVEGS